MALLTAEDVLNKAFSKTKYREGFDQDEVDDFLDEVANTIAQLTAERDEFAARLASGGTAAAPAPAAEAPPVTSAGGVPGTTGLLAAATEPGGVNPTGMLAMAQKLHDEYVQAGEAERDRIIDEAHAAADQVRERADEDAKARMDALSGERADLEARIDDLRRFERDYRARLKAYLENLLGDLDHAGTGGAPSPAEGFPAAPEAVVAEAVVAEAVAEADADEPATEPAADEVAESADEAPVATYETEDGDADAEVVIVDEYEPEAAAEADEPVSFEKAVAGFEEFVPAPQEPQAAQPEATAYVAPPSYDATQPWEQQLRPQGESAPLANPFAPVTPQAAGGDVPGVEAEAGEDAPYTPPSSRMFTDLYGQRRTESES